MTGPIFLRTIARALAILAALSAVLGAAPVMAQPNGPAGWCAEGQSEHLGFRLDNGKTVSICEDEDGLTYSFGHVGAALELRYSGKVVADTPAPRARCSRPSTTLSGFPVLRS